MKVEPLDSGGVPFAYDFVYARGGVRHVAITTSIRTANARDREVTSLTVYEKTGSDSSR